MPASAQPSRYATLHQRIQHELRERILAGVYRPQQQLPTEIALMQQYGVSRITVRHALGALEKEQLIVRQAGRGSFVTQPKPFQALGRLQGFAEAMGAQGHAAYNRVLSLHTVPASAQVAAHLRLPDGALVTEIRRVRYLDRQAVSLDHTWVPLSIGERLAREDLEGRDIFLILEQDYGLPLGHADTAIEAVSAEPEVAAQLGVAAGAPLLRVERLTHGQDGTPLDYEHLYCRSDNFQYRLRVLRHAVSSNPSQEPYANH